jgi:hypothetical protein
MFLVSIVLFRFSISILHPSTLHKFRFLQISSKICPTMSSKKTFLLRVSPAIFRDCSCTSSPTCPISRLKSNHLAARALNHLNSELVVRGDSRFADKVLLGGASGVFVTFCADCMCNEYQWIRICNHFHHITTTSLSYTNYFLYSVLGQRD